MTQSSIRIFAVIVTILGTLSAAPAQQPSTTRHPDTAAAPQQPPAGSKAPDNIEIRMASVISEGVRLHAEIYSLKSLAGKPLPTIIQAHGWGGVAANFRWDSITLANAGYLVIAFDYRGWGQSDGRVVLKA